MSRRAIRGSRALASRQRRSKKNVLYTAQEGRCAKCNNPAEKPDLILKHIVHRKAGGASTLANLHLICHPCNKNGPRQKPGAVN